MSLTENEIKKEYLREYRMRVRRAGRIEAELEELRSMKISISMNNDGMPHSPGQSDLSGYAARLDRLERLLASERCKRIDGYERISGHIRELGNENERDVLFYRYIKGFTWWEIAEKMGYSERHITRIHGEALAHLKLQEKEKMS